MQPDDAVTLQVNGVPVLVNPESELHKNEVASIVLNPCVDVNGNSKKCEVGPDEITIAQLDNFEPKFDESVTLQVNGVPVLVNPESDLLSNDMASARLNPCEDINGNPRKCTIGPDDVSIAQMEKNKPAFDDAVVLQVNGVPVLVNPESELMVNQMASARLMGQNDKPLEVGPDNITLSMTTGEYMRPAEYQTLLINGAPVLVNMNEGPHDLSVLQLAGGEIMKVLY